MTQFHDDLKFKMDDFIHKEVKYLLYFSLVENYLSKKDYERAIKLAEDIGAMLWGILRKL